MTNEVTNINEIGPILGNNSAEPNKPENYLHVADKISKNVTDNAIFSTLTLC